CALQMSANDPKRTLHSSTARVEPGHLADILMVRKFALLSLSKWIGLAHDRPTSTVLRRLGGACRNHKTHRCRNPARSRAVYYRNRVAIRRCMCLRTVPAAEGRI